MFSNPQPPPLPHPRVSEAPLEFRWLFGGANMQCDAADMHCAVANMLHGGANHGHILRTAHKLSATTVEHSHWTTGHSTNLWLADN